jgi:hypothetical protein
MSVIILLYDAFVALWLVWVSIRECWWSGGDVVVGCPCLRS